jgi:hypothetical protein
MTSQSQRKHVRTGKPRDGHPGNAYSFRHGLRSAAVVAQRKSVNALLRQCRALLREAAT